MIAAIIALITEIGPLGIQLFDTLKGSLTLGPDEQQNIINAVAASQTADAATIAAAQAWLAANPPTTPPVIA
jgi:hypothetical protein